MRKVALIGAAMLAALLIAPPTGWACGGSDVGMACCPGLAASGDSCHPQMQIAMACCEERPAEKPTGVVPATGSAPLSPPVLAVGGAHLLPAPPAPAVAPALGGPLVRAGQERLQLFSTLLL